jgi:hypothetical protein
VGEATTGRYGRQCIRLRPRTSVAQKPANRGSPFVARLPVEHRSEAVSIVFLDLWELGIFTRRAERAAKCETCHTYLVPAEIGSEERMRRNVTNGAVIEIVERGRALGLPDGEVDRMVYASGCIRVIHKSDTLIVYYHDQDGQERFVICAPGEFSDR